MENYESTTGLRRAGNGLAVLAVLALGAAWPRPAAAAVAGAAAPSIYWTMMPRVDSVIVDKKLSIAIRYKRVQGYLHTLRVYQGDQKILETTDQLGNISHDNPFFSYYADKTGYFYSWFGIVLPMMGSYGYADARQTQPIYLETCYASPAGPPTCMKSGAYNFDVRQEYPFTAGDWTARLTSGPRDKNRVYTPPADKHVGGYYTNWSTYSRNYQPKDIPVESLTHVYHAFLGVCSDTFNQRAQTIENANVAAGVDGKPYTSMKNSCAAAQAKEFEVAMSDPWADVQKTGFDAAEARNLCAPGDNYCAYPKEPFAGIYAEYYRMKAGLAARGKKTKVLLSIGGYSLSDPFFELAKTSAGRNAFVDSVTRFLTKYDVFDGVDIDWEFPGDPLNPGVANEAADKANFVELMALMRTKLDGLRKVTGKRYELTMAVGPSLPDHVNKLDLAGLGAYVDRMNLMTYDYWGTWNNVFGHHAAFAFCSNGLKLQESPFAYGLRPLGAAANYVDMSQLNLGVASYGYGWKNVNGFGNGPAASPNAVPVAAGAGTFPVNDFRRYIWAPGIIAFKGIEKFQIGAGAPAIAQHGQFLYDTVNHSIEAVFGPGAKDYGPAVARDYGCNSATDFLWMKETATTKGAFVTYDSPSAVTAKASYVKTNPVGGIFMWELAGDSGTLLNSIHTGLGSTLK